MVEDRYVEEVYILSIIIIYFMETKEQTAKEGGLGGTLVTRPGRSQGHAFGPLITKPFFVIETHGIIYPTLKTMPTHATTNTNILTFYTRTI